MTDTVRKTMAEHGMTDISSVLVGLSGGADSAALVHILKELSSDMGFKVYAAHVNHGIRGDEADRDEEFSRRMAQELGIDFFSLHADVPMYAKEHGMSEEQAGRAIRYAFFDELMDKYGIECTATAHHKNDNAETIVMNFMRGSALSGLCGIPYTRGRIIRPLLDVSRAEIEKYCAENGIEYVTDATNLEEDYTRNKIRRRLIPEIESEFNPSFVSTVTKNAALIACEDDFLRAHTDKLFCENVRESAVSVSLIKSLHPAMRRRLVRKMIEGSCGITDVSSSVIDSAVGIALCGKTGSVSDINADTVAAVAYGKLGIRRRTAEDTPFSYRIDVGKTVSVPEAGVTVTALDAGGGMGEGEYFSVPQDAILEIRSRRSGDVFRPCGMSGTKKLREYMIDEKIPRDMRGKVCLFTVNGDIAWVIGHRRSRGFEYTGKGIRLIIKSI